MKLQGTDGECKMEVLYPGNLALLSMFLKNPESEKQQITKEKKKGEGGECADVLTCGRCQKDFLLADILRFIQHKVHNCQGPPAAPPPASGCFPDARGDSNNPEELQQSRRPSPTKSTSRDRNGDLGSDAEGSSPSSPVIEAVKEEDEDEVGCDESKGEEKRKRDDDEESTLSSARKRPRSTQDAEANTTDSEPARYVCGTCSAVLGSAWSLVQHVQTSHGIIIYQEASGSGIPAVSVTAPILPTTPPGLPKPSHSSPLASVSSTATTATGSGPVPLLDPTKVDLSKVDLTKVDLSKLDMSKIVPPVTSGATPLPPHPPVTAPLLDPNHPFNLLRMPLGDARAPGFPPGLTPPFVRPGHDFRVDQILQEGLRLNPASLLPPHFDRPPFLDPGLGAPRHPAPTPLNPGGDPNLDFYSQRLRQLAGTTSPTSSTSPRKPLLTPPFSSPGAPASSTPTPAHAQTPTSTRTDPSTQIEKRFKCETCGKGFRWECNLAIHQRVHSVDKDFRCPKCQEVTETAQALRKHMRSHRASSAHDSNSPDSSRPQVEDENDEIEEEEEEDEEEEEEEETNPSASDSMDEEEEDFQPEDNEDDDTPEDLSTSKSSSTPTSQNVSSSTATSGEKEKPVERHDIHPQHHQHPPRSVVGELMDRFGLANISAYSEAYRQALKESGRIPPSLHKDGEKGMSTGNGIEKTLKFREDLAKGIIGGQPHLDLAHQTLLGAFDNPYEARKHLASVGRDGLYAGLWLPTLTGSGTAPRDLFPGVHADNSFMQRKLMSDGSLKADGAPTLPKAGTSQTPGAPLSLVPPPKKERGTRNDTCEFCGKVFKNCSNLTVHRRSHTGEKPYKCDLCSYACAQSSKLTRHMKTHGRLGKDVFRCRFCEMPFSVASTLEKHMRKCVVNQNSKGLFPPISAAGHEGVEAYKGLHFPPVMSDDSSKSGSLFTPHFTTTSVNTSNDDTGDSSNLSGAGS